MALSPSDVETPVLMWQSGDSECVCPSWITWSGSENVNRRWSIWPRDLWSVREDWLMGLVWSGSYHVCPSQAPVGQAVLMAACPGDGAAPHQQSHWVTRALKPWLEAEPHSPVKVGFSTLVVALVYSGLLACTQGQVIGGLFKHDCGQTPRLLHSNVTSVFPACSLVSLILSLYLPPPPAPSVLLNLQGENLDLFCLTSPFNNGSPCRSRSFFLSDVLWLRSRPPYLSPSLLVPFCPQFLASPLPPLCDDTSLLPSDTGLSHLCPVALGPFFFKLSVLFQVLHVDQ